MAKSNRRRIAFAEPLEARVMLAADFRVHDVNTTGRPAIDDTIAFQGKLFYRDYNSHVGAELFAFDPVTRTSSLVADVNPGAADSYPGFYGEFLALEDRLYFNAFDSEYGFELREFDSLSGETTLVGDVHEGLESSNAGEFALFSFDNKVYFSADDGLHGVELYEFDPATRESRMVADINPGAESSFAGEFGFAAFDNKLYFSALDAANGHELREYDPATGIVSLVADIAAGVDSSNSGGASGFIELGGQLYFSAEDANGNELRRFDPATRRVTQPMNLPGFLAQPGLYGGMIEFNGQLYFDAYVSLHGRELWRFDPATDRMSLAADINPRREGSLTEPFGGIVRIGDELFFSAYDEAHGTELRAFNPITETIRLIEIQPGEGSASPGELGGLQLVNGKLYFSADDGVHGVALHEYDPVEDRTRMVSDFYGEEPWSSSFKRYASLTVVDSRLYFVTEELTQGYALREFDPATDEVEVVVDLFNGTNSSGAGSGGLTVANGKLYFGADDPLFGYELHEYDPHGETIRLVADINPGPSPSLGFGELDLIEIDDKVYFPARDESNGFELRRFDPVTGAVDIVAETYPGVESSICGFLDQVGDEIYFYGCGAEHGGELRVFEPIANEVRLVADIQEGPAGSGTGSREGVFEFENKIYFNAADRDHGAELRVYDPATGETELVKDIFFGSESSRAGIGGFAGLNGRLYFAATDGEHGVELHVYDPLTESVELVADIAPGEESSEPWRFHVLDGRLYFTALREVYLEQLFEYDPAAGTVRAVASDGPGTPNTRVSRFSEIKVFDGKLFFIGDDGIHGNELRQYDPVTDEFSLVADLVPGEGAAMGGRGARPFYEYGGRLYFVGG